jgi:hypothetical protein
MQLLVYGSARAVCGMQLGVGAAIQLEPDFASVTREQTQPLLNLRLGNQRPIGDQNQANATGDAVLFAQPTNAVDDVAKVCATSGLAIARESNVFERASLGWCVVFQIRAPAHGIE